MQPIPGMEQQVAQLLDRNLEWIVNREGFVLGLNLEPGTESQAIVRVVVWENSTDATATSDHALAIRSQLIGLALDQVIHVEEFCVRSYKAHNRA